MAVVVLQVALKPTQQEEGELEAKVGIVIVPASFILYQEAEVDLEGREVHPVVLLLV